jgi:multicomponent Na+:H+ antiporter subunit E
LAVVTRFVATFSWTMAAWIVLTWTLSAEQLIFGAATAAAVALLVSPLGPIARPWRLLEPRRLVRLITVAGSCLVRIAAANLSLARRIWSPGLPIRPGMLVVPTRVTSEGGLIAVGLLSSVIVDNQLVDLDLRHRELEYHAVWIETTDPERARESINGRLEDLIRPLESPESPLDAETGA